MAEETARRGSIYGGSGGALRRSSCLELRATWPNARSFPPCTTWRSTIRLGERYAIVGFARTPMTDESFPGHDRRSGEDHFRGGTDRTRQVG